MNNMASHRKVESVNYGMDEYVKRYDLRWFVHLEKTEIRIN